MMRFVTDSITGKVILKMKTLGIGKRQSTFVVFYDNTFCILKGICTGRVELEDAFRPLEWCEGDLDELGIVSCDEYAGLVQLETELSTENTNPKG